MTMYSGYSSDEEEHEEDPNIPSDVECSHNDFQEFEDNLSVVSDHSGTDWKELEFSHACSPDLAEVANLTLNVNYGDLANMASHPIKTRTRLTLLDPALTADNVEDLTWSEMLDTGIEGQGTGFNKEPTFLWTQGHEETESLGGFSLTSDHHYLPSRGHKRRPSHGSVRSLNRLSMPRPLNALRRFLARREEGKVAEFDFQVSERTTETSSCSVQGKARRPVRA
mmetsp:Transcript_28116/g.39517  ORF Transcript_28116/g.39517 Transcript_28116/m.39517 type:complete len:224 (+) Transcript_28116:69-740(+)